jgi:Peptidase family M28
MKIAALVVLLLLVAAWVLVVQPLAGKGPPWQGPPADAARLQATVRGLVALGRRDDEAGMARAAAFLEAQLRALGLSPAAQDYRFDNGHYRNLIVSFGPEGGQLLVIGAHYDVRGPYAGADDNASGTAGLLELARLFRAHPPQSRVDLVFYPREEVSGMGSEVHAKSLRPDEVRGMVVLEMIGCFDQPQQFPFKLLGWLYPSQGNYIVVVGRPRDFALVRKLKRGIASTGLGVESIDAPEAVRGIGNSDHRSYWRQGIRAAMVTDTAWFRNPRYHTAQDTPDTLDYVRMAQVVDGVAAAVSAIPR